MSELSLSKLLVPSKTAEVEYPGTGGDFKVQVAFLSRDSLQKIRTRATKTTFKNRAAIEELDDDLFLQLYVQATVKGWVGLKFKHLQNLTAIGDVSAEEQDTELPFTEDNALQLMKSSVNFDNFVSEKVSDLTNFTKSRSTQSAPK